MYYLKMSSYSSGILLIDMTQYISQKLKWKTGYKSIVVYTNQTRDALFSGIFDLHTYKVIR